MKKLMNKKGFTLMEMLIVVAIIVILVAVSVPVFSSSLNSANAAVDAANLRAAKAAGIAKALENDADESLNGFYIYDITTGTLGIVSEEVPKSATASGSCSVHESSYIVVEVDGKTSTAAWYKAGVADATACAK